MAIGIKIKLVAPSREQIEEVKGRIEKQLGVTADVEDIKFGEIPKLDVQLDFVSIMRQFEKLVDLLHSKMKPIKPKFDFAHPTNEAKKFIQKTEEMIKRWDGKKDRITGKEFKVIGFDRDEFGRLQIELKNIEGIIKKVNFLWEDGGLKYQRGTQAQSFRQQIEQSFSGIVDKIKFDELPKLQFQVDAPFLQKEINEVMSTLEPIPLKLDIDEGLLGILDNFSKQIETIKESGFSLRDTVKDVTMIYEDAQGNIETQKTQILRDNSIIQQQHIQEAKSVEKVKKATKDVTKSQQELTNEVGKTRESLKGLEEDYSGIGKILGKKKYYYSKDAWEAREHEPPDKQTTTYLTKKGEQVKVTRFSGDDSFEKLEDDEKLLRLEKKLSNFQRQAKTIIDQLREDFSSIVPQDMLNELNELEVKFENLSKSDIFHPEDVKKYDLELKELKKTMTEVGKAEKSRQDAAEKFKESSLIKIDKALKEHTKTSSKESIRDLKQFGEQVKSIDTKDKTVDVDKMNKQLKLNLDIVKQSKKLNEDERRILEEKVQILKNQYRQNELIRLSVDDYGRVKTKVKRETGETEDRDYLFDRAYPTRHLKLIGSKTTYVNNMQKEIESFRNSALKDLDRVIYRFEKLVPINTIKDAKKLREEIEKIKITDKNVNTNALKKFKDRVRETTGEIRQLGEERIRVNKGITFGQALRTAFEKIPVWAIGTSTIYGGIHKFKEGIQYITDIDDALISLWKVSNETRQNLREFAIEANEIGFSLAKTTAEVINATVEFSRLGYELGQARILATQASLYSNVGYMDIVEASQSIISALKGFNLEVDASGKNVKHIVDMYNEIGNNFAISSRGIGEAMQRSAASLAGAGNTIEEAVAMITAANAVNVLPHIVVILYAYPEYAGTL